MMIRAGNSPPARRRASPLASSIAALALLRAGPAPGQQPRSPGEGPAAASASTPSKTQKVADLTPRYRFAERYTVDDKRVGPGVIGPSRVAVLETARDSVESAQGAPRRTESTRQAIYAERPAETGSVGVVVSTARVYEKYLAKPEDASPGAAGRPLEGATLLVRPRLGDPPQVLCLTPGRSLTESEYQAIGRQVYVPHLAMILPAQAVRLGDTWRVPRKGAQALLGDPSIQGDTLVGKLAEVRKEVDGPRMVASIAITGKVAAPGEETTVNAEVLFTFQASTIPREPARKSGMLPLPTGDQVDSPGAVTEVRLASITTGAVTGPGRLRFQSNRELTLHRQLGASAGAAPVPPVAEVPEPDEANSWLSRADPSGHSTFRHPQDFVPPSRAQPPAEAGTTLLYRAGRDGRDMFQLKYSDKVLAPEDLRKEMAERYQALKMEVLNGEELWLPEADWPGMKVHRIDAAVKMVDPKAVRSIGSTRVHFDGYLIQFPRAASILVIASTSKEAVAPFRTEVERVLRSIKIDPGRSLPMDKAPRPPDAARSPSR